MDISLLNYNFWILYPSSGLQWLSFQFRSFCLSENEEVDRERPLRGEANFYAICAPALNHHICLIKGISFFPARTTVGRENYLLLRVHIRDFTGRVSGKVKGSFILLCRIFSVDRPTKLDWKLVTQAVWLPLEAYKLSNSNFLGRSTEKDSAKQNK